MFRSILFTLLLGLNSFAFEIGNDPNGGGTIDGWSAVMVIDETSTYTNTSGADELVTPTGFDFQVGNNRGRVTPFLVKVNANNNFTVLAIGTTRVSGPDYSSTGVFEFDFGNAPPSITLAHGETLAAGMTNANPDGSGNSSSVIPYNNSGHDSWVSGGSSSANTGSLTLNNAPVPGTSTLDLGRTYAFAIDVTIQSAANDPPSDLLFTGGHPLPGMPIGSTLGILTSVDPNADDTHTYSLITNPNGAFTLENDLLKTASATGAPGTSTTIRLKTTDSKGNTFEKNLTFTVETQLPPTELTLDATSLSSLAGTGSPAAQIFTTDANGADQFTYSLVSGNGDLDNSFFTVNDNALLLASPFPANQVSATFRLRTTDLAGNSFEKSFTLPILTPSLVLNEFAASNSSLTDEDGDTPDWIELYNAGTSCVDLDAWLLSDDPGEPAKWTFPATMLAPGQYLLLFASGKDRAISGAELHTNFSLSSNGETLTLSAPGGSMVSQILSPPAQFPNVTFGYNSTQDLLGYLTPTPAAPNGPTFEKAADEVTFDQIRGTYTTPFTLTLTAPPGTQIRYTTNGSPPTSSSLLYTAPLTVSPPNSGSTSGLRTIRAAAFGGNSLLQPVTTHTYLFIDNVVNQTVLRSSITSNPAYSDLIDDALLAHPIISITRPAGLPNGTESETSLEFFDPSNPADHFQVDCGIKVVGGHSVGSPKNNFRLYFRSQYGQSKLSHPLFANHLYSNGAAETFGRLNLRSGSHDSFFWLANPANPSNSGGPIRGDAQYIRNRWMSDMQLRMGHPALHGRWVQVFINGSYHGQYQLLEHPNQDFQSSYLGGESTDYEFTNAANTSKTGSDNWQATWSQLKTASNGTAATAARWIDLQNLADYMILNFYAGNPWDWNPNQNWMAGGPNQIDRGGWKFYSWDADIIFQDPGANVLAKNVPDGLFQNLLSDPDFVIIFRDRLYQHCFHDGLLSPTEAQSVFDTRASEIEISILAETARWQGSASNPPWDRDDEWHKELTRMRTTFFPLRSNTLLNQVRARGWYPVEAPEFTQRGGEISPGYQPNLSASTGTIYYTLDGSDPRLAGGAISPSAHIYTPASLTLDSATLIRTRALQSSEWSPLNEASFIIAGTLPANLDNLAITEIHYHPSAPTLTEIAAGFIDDRSFAFIELTNFSSNPIDLSNVTFTAGISFTFPFGSILAARDRILVVKDQDAFLARHPGLESSLAGEFANDSSLSNSGEQITLLAADASTIADFTYNDKLPWPNESDGDGYSLVLRATQLDPAQPENWRSSATQHGNPAATDTTPFPLGGNLISHALASTTQTIKFTSAGGLKFTYLAQLTADDVTYTLQQSPDLNTWTAVTDFKLDDRDNLGNGTIKTTLQSPAPITGPKKFYRLVVATR